VVVLAEAFWRRRFGADLSVVGRMFPFGGKAVTVIGVASKRFSGLSMEQPDFWAPLNQQPYLASGSTLLTDYAADSSGVAMFGRLRAALSPKIAEDELRVLAADLRKAHPAEMGADTWDKETLPAEPGGYAKSLLIGNRRGSGREDQSDLYPLVGMIVSLCLLILAVACGNLGSLLLARGVAREREMSIRVSVGAGRARLVRQLFTESVVLSVLGALGGVGVGWAVLRGLVVMSRSPEWLDASPDWRVVVFALGVGFVAAVLFGLMPATQVARQKHRSTKVRHVLVGAQVAASCVLLIVAGLLVRALVHATSMDPGFEYQRMVVIDPGLGTHGYTAEKARSYLETLQTRLRAAPGVEAVALTDTAPLGNRVSSASVQVDGVATEILLNHVDPNFLRTMRIPLLLGRGLQAGDAHSIVIGQTMAARLWPGKNALGKRFSVDGEDAEVVGIAGSARLVRPEDGGMTELYSLAKPADLPGMIVVVRTAGSPSELARAAVSIAIAINPAVFPAVDLLKSSFGRKLETAQSGMLAVSLLGLAAQLLACLGIVGVVAYAVSQRGREIGIRMALGAKPGQVLKVVLRQFVWPVAAGLAVGVAGAAAVSQLLRKVLYGISNLDPAAYAGAIVVFAVTVGLAAWLPARRALRVDPMPVLRQD
jgi:predicted permease